MWAEWIEWRAGKGFEGPAGNTEVIHLTFCQRVNRCLCHPQHFTDGRVASAVRLEHSNQEESSGNFLSSADLNQERPT